MTTTKPRPRATRPFTAIESDTHGRTAVRALARHNLPATWKRGVLDLVAMTGRPVYIGRGYVPPHYAPTIEAHYGPVVYLDDPLVIPFSKHGPYCDVTFRYIFDPATWRHDPYHPAWGNRAAYARCFPVWLTPDLPAHYRPPHHTEHGGQLDGQLMLAYRENVGWRWQTHFHYMCPGYDATRLINKAMKQDDLAGAYQVAYVPNMTYFLFDSATKDKP